MRRAGGAAALLAASLSVAHAQVRTNTHALDALAPARKAAPITSHPPHAHHSPHAAPVHARPAHAGAAPARIRAPTMAPHPPPPVVIAPPPIHVATHPPPPPPPVPVDPHANGTAAAIAGGTRLSFAAGSAAINGAMMAALHAESTALKSDADDVATIDAYAAGTADDPSTARRLSLQRALVARAVLINDGVPSTRIYARALGTPAAGETDAPPDRLDLTLAPLGGAPVPDTGTAGAGEKAVTP